MAKPKTSGAQVAPLTSAKYDKFENRSTGEKFEMDGYVKAKSFSAAFRALEEQAEHITGEKDIIKNSVLGGDEFGSWSRSVKNHPDNASDDYSVIDNSFSGGELRSFWRDKTDGRYHRMHIEQIDEEYFYIDFGRSKKY